MRPWVYRLAPHIPILSDQLFGPSGSALSSHSAICGSSRKRSKKSLRLRPVRASTLVETPPRRCPAVAEVEDPPVPRAVLVHVLGDEDVQVLLVRPVHTAVVPPRHGVLCVFMPRPAKPPTPSAATTRVPRSADPHRSSPRPCHFPGRRAEELRSSGRAVELRAAEIARSSSLASVSSRLTT